MKAKPRLIAIGDVHGHLQTLLQLLDQSGWQKERDRLWFVGDLVNRGPDSPGVLRFVKNLGEGAVVVLGNHDLHLLAVAAGIRDSNSFDDILGAEDREELLDWLRSRPLAYREGAGPLLVHAGLLPQWSADQALSLAAEVEQALRLDRGGKYLAGIYGNDPDRWQETLTGAGRLRMITNALTRMRFCRPDHSLDLECSEAPGNQPAGLRPWFEMAAADPACEVVCGHWASLGAGRHGRVLALDSGCAWGGPLSGCVLEANGRREIFSVPSQGGAVGQGEDGGRFSA